MGWTYWFCWVVIGIADIVGITGYMQFWWPDIPLWLPGLFCVIVMASMNMLTVKLFGEMEFWFALTKIIAIIGLVLTGAYLILIGFVDPVSGEKASLSHLWARPAGFSQRHQRLFLGVSIAFFAFLGLNVVARRRQNQRPLHQFACGD